MGMDASRVERLVEKWSVWWGGGVPVWSVLTGDIPGIRSLQIDWALSCGEMDM